MPMVYYSAVKKGHPVLWRANQWGVRPLYLYRLVEFYVNYKGAKPVKASLRYWRENIEPIVHWTPSWGQIYYFLRQAKHYHQHRFKC